MPMAGTAINPATIIVTASRTPHAADPLTDGGPVASAFIDPPSAL